MREPAVDCANSGTPHCWLTMGAVVVVGVAVCVVTVAVDNVDPVVLRVGNVGDLVVVAVAVVPLVVNIDVDTVTVFVGRLLMKKSIINWSKLFGRVKSRT